MSLLGSILAASCGFQSHSFQQAALTVRPWTHYAYLSPGNQSIFDICGDKIGMSITKVKNITIMLRYMRRLCEAALFIPVLLRTPITMDSRNSSSVTSMKVQVEIPRDTVLRKVTAANLYVSRLQTVTRDKAKSANWLSKFMQAVKFYHAVAKHEPGMSFMAKI